MQLSRRWRSAAATLAVSGVLLGATAAAPAQAADELPIVYGWGINGDGQLGIGTTTDVTVPVPVVGMATDVVQINDDLYYSVMVRADGSVWTWGENRDGRLGDGSSVISRSTPGQVPGLPAIREVSAGPYHVLALDTSGKVWAWGTNDHGELGDGTTVSRTTPVRVPLPWPVTQVAAGFEFSLVLRPNGEVYGWGRNNFGQLGNGYTTDSLTPVKFLAPDGIIEISTQEQHSLALRNDGSVWAWGRNERGALGDGTTANYSPYAVRAQGLNSGIVHVVASNGFSMALGAEGSVWTWGVNFSGNLGDGTTDSRNTPVRIGLSGIKQIDAGVGNGTAIDSNGQLWVWGGNYSAQSGTGSNSPNILTTPSLVPNMSGVVAVSAGFLHLHAIAAPHDALVFNLIGDQATNAPSRLQAVGLALGSTFTVPDDPYCKNIGKIQNQSPASGTLVPFSSKVDIYEYVAPSSGCYVATPNLIGTSKFNASSRLQEVGLVLGSTFLVPDDRQCNYIGDIEDQNPPPGTLLLPGSKVNIYVYTAPGGGCV